MLPFISSLIGAGLRLVANAALVKGKEFIEERTGVELDRPKLSPEDVLKLRKFEMEHEEELLRLQMEDNRLSLEETKAYLADVQDARQNMTEMQENANVPLFSKLVQPILACFVVLASVVLFSLFVYWSGDKAVLDKATGTYSTVARINPVQKDIIIYILGALTAAVTQVLGYYFGSSSSSARKSEQLGSVLRK